MFDTEKARESWFWTVTAAIVAVTIATLAYGVSDLLPASNTVPSQPASTSLPAQASLFKTPTAPPPLARSGVTTVFECHSGAERIYSDHRCAPGAKERSVPTPNSMNAQDTSNLLPPDEVMRRSQVERAARQEGTTNHAQSACEELQQEKDLINARMRQGYGLAEGEQLRRRLREISGEYFELRCHTL